MHGLENRLNISCPLGLAGRDLFNGSTSFVGCVHIIAWATTHSARPDERPCAAVRFLAASGRPWLRLLLVTPVLGN